MAGRQILRVQGIMCMGEVGVLCGDEERVGWCCGSAAAGRGFESVSMPVASIQKAEWYQGQVRLQCEQDGKDSPEVMFLQGFRAADFDALWRYLGTFSNTYLHKIPLRSSCTATEFDEALLQFESAAERVSESASGSVQRKARENNVMQTVEVVLGALERAIDGDRQELCEVFGADDHRRTEKLRHLLDMLRLDLYGQDPRWLRLRKFCDTIEGILADMGTFRFWAPWEESVPSPRPGYRRWGRSASELDEDDESAADVGASGVHHASREGEDIESAAAVEASGYTEASREDEADAAAVVMTEASDSDSRECDTPAPPIVRRCWSADDGLLGVAAARIASSASSSGGPGAFVAGAGPSACRRGLADFAERGNGRLSPQGLRKGSPAQPAPRIERGPSMSDGLEGWVWKRSRYICMWRRRYLVLRSGILIFYRDESCGEGTEAFAASFVSHVTEKTDRSPAEIWLETSTRTYRFVCEAPGFREECLRKLSAASGAAQKRQAEAGGRAGIELTF